MTSLGDGCATSGAEPPARSGAAGSVSSGAAPVGRREAHKHATREALRSCAARLFDEHGYRSTTVRDIAEAAGVTERTFFRYFASKVDLVAEEVLSWLPLLQDRIVTRPPDEDPLTAVRGGLREVGREMGSALGAAPVWLFLDGPPGRRLSRSGPRPMLRFEAALTEAIEHRLRAGAAGDERDAFGYEAEVLARTAVALVRSALIASARAEGWPRTAGMRELLDRAFGMVRVT